MIALSRFIGIFFFLIQVASFTCWVLLFRSLSPIVAVSQAVVWFVSHSIVCNDGFIDIRC